MLHTLADAIAWLRHWHRRLPVPPGLPAAALPLDLPDPLALLYRELGGWIAIEPGPGNDHRAPFAAQDVLLPLARLRRVDGLLEFAWENQGNWSARCMPGPGDPPVLTSAGPDGSGSRTFEPACASLERFLVTLCLQEALMSAPCLYATDAVSAAAAFECPLQALWLQGPWAVPGDSRDFHVVPGMDVIAMDCGEAWVGARDAAVERLLLPQHRDHRLR